MKRVLPILLLIMSALSSCQMTFYLDNPWEDAEKGATPLDRALIFRQEELRLAYREGVLERTDGLYLYDTVKYVIQREENCFYVVFFGSESIRDIYYDMLHWQEPFWTDIDPEITVHAGFNRPLQEALTPVEGELARFLADYPNPEDRNLFFLGHSAGGVHALLCAFSMAALFSSLEDREIYCQIGGSPAPGNKAFVKAFDRRINCHRYINGSDQVPSLLTPQMGYFHGGKGYRIGGDPNPLTCLTGLWINDHFIWDYADSLR